MGFRTGAYATVWDIKVISQTRVDLRVSTSRKNKETGAYENDFSGFVRCVGTAAASMAAKLHERDRIKLGDVDVTNRYEESKKTTYTNFAVFSFEVVDGNNGGNSGGNKIKSADRVERIEARVDSGELDDSLPF